MIKDTMIRHGIRAYLARQYEDQYWDSGFFWYDSGRSILRYNHVRKTADPDVADKQYAVIAPTLHCSYTRATENTIVGERSMGDARLDYNALTYGWFDYFLKDEKNDILKMPKVRYFTMGSNKWQSADSFPPAGAQPMTFYLSEQWKGEYFKRRRQISFDAARKQSAG